MEIKKIYIFAEGTCWKRSLDADKISKYLIKNNHTIVNKPEDADIIILITCGFINDRTEYFLKKVKEFQKYNAELIVGGCVPGIDKEELEKTFNGKVIITKNLDNIDSIFPENKIKFEEINDSNLLYQNQIDEGSIGIIKKILRKIKWLEKILIKIQDYILKHLFGEKSIEYKFSKKQYLIRVSWGCLGSCTYCAIKKAVGTHKSKPIDTCIKEFKEGLNQGYNHFCLEADDLGAYGLDIKSNFPILLDELTKIPGEYEITMRGIHPKWIIRYVDEIEEILKRGKIPIVDVALQSANSRILELMHRYSNVEQMKDALLRIKKAYPALALSAEIILGFPTETDDEFNDTISFIKEVDLRAGHIYLFSCKTGTEAENIKPKISDEVLEQRTKHALDYLKKEGYYVTYLKKEQFISFSKRSG